jgi:uncharacterized lipoprotein
VIERSKQQGAQMLKPSIAADSSRIHPLAIALSLACLLFWADHGHAERLKQRGVAIPDAPDMFFQGTTLLDRNDSGADLTLPLDANETWQLLNRVLTDLGIKPKQQDAQRQHLLTDWVLWIWDPNLETGRSKPPLKALTRTYERHRFEFSVSPAAANAGALIHIGDTARQREVDITPDSEYTWLQWQDAPVQVDAAWSFMRRLQGNFESALSSRVMPSTVASPRIIEPVRPSEPTREATPVIPKVPVHTPAPVIVAPVSTLSTPAPVPAPPVPKQSSDQPDQSKPATVEHRQAVADESTKSTNTPALPVAPPTVEPQSVEQQTPPGAERPQDTATQSPASVSVPPPDKPLAVQGGLLVDGGLDATWQALLPAIDALGIKLQSSDPVQHMLTTQWIDARSDKKNQQFTLESKGEERWAFDLWGKGQQRHRFQLILIPADGGARTMVYAYHTGFQVETDQTPDSSQTLLYWKDHKTEPAIAMAFLRRLQLVVRQ